MLPSVLTHLIWSRIISFQHSISVYDRIWWICARFLVSAVYTEMWRRAAQSPVSRYPCQETVVFWVPFDPSHSTRGTQGSSCASAKMDSLLNRATLFVRTTGSEPRPLSSLSFFFSLGQGIVCRVMLCRFYQFGSAQPESARSHAIASARLVT